MGASFGFVGSVSGSALGSGGEDVTSLSPVVMIVSLVILVTVAIAVVPGTVMVHLLRTGAKLRWPSGIVASY